MGFRELRKNNPGAMIGYLQRDLKHTCDRGLAPYGLTYSLYAYLIYMEHQRDCSLADLAHGLGVNKGHVTRTVASLESLGYVEKKHDPEDSRAFCLSLTPQGQEMLKVFLRLFEEWAQDLQKGLTPEEYNNLVELLRKAVWVKRTIGTDLCPK